MANFTSDRINISLYNADLDSENVFCFRSKTFSSEIDESTLPDDRALLHGYVGSIDNEKTCQYYSVQPTQNVLQFTML